MLVDEVEIKIKAGDGGNGKIAFIHKKFVPRGGPSGGDGGKGGDVYVEGVNDIGALSRFRYRKEFLSENGQNGMKDRKTGKGSSDLVLKVPIGSIITDNFGISREIISVGQKVCLAKGGKGGRGNWYFRSSTNQTPRWAEPGEKGEEKHLKIELKLIADVGLIGLPNVGKTSLLNELTRASAKVANYPFTTLEPNLGVMGDLILADIPGLIEGAAEGRGLGHKFLRHIQRTKILIHCLSAESIDLLKDYQIIRQELEKFSQDLLAKKEILLLTKADLLGKVEKKEKIKILKNLNKRVLAVSVYDLDSLQFLQKLVLKTLG
jgi:GTP-binding protein